MLSVVAHHVLQQCIVPPPFSHGQLYVPFSRVRDCGMIALHVCTSEQLHPSIDSATQLMPVMENIEYHVVLALNYQYLSNHNCHYQ
jgi:hypothetical protein